MRMILQSFFLGLYSTCPHAKMALGSLSLRSAKILLNWTIGQQLHRLHLHTGICACDGWMLYPLVYIKSNSFSFALHSLSLALPLLPSFSYTLFSIFCFTLLCIHFVDSRWIHSRFFFISLDSQKKRVFDLSPDNCMDAECTQWSQHTHKLYI